MSLEMRFPAVKPVWKASLQPMVLMTLLVGITCDAGFFELASQETVIAIFVLTILSWVETPYLTTLPDPSPPIKARTSATLTRLKSPLIECLRQLAATANSSASASVSQERSP